MPANEIRRCVTITNRLNPDLIVMTGDFVAWDPEAEDEVVQALSGLRAPYGIFGCLGNHETETQTEESITRLFAGQNVRILRQEHARIQVRGETLNLIGVDDSLSRSGVVKPLMMPDTVYICALYAHSGSCPPESSCCIEAIIVFRPALARTAASWVSAEVLANHTGKETGPPLRRESTLLLRMRSTQGLFHQQTRLFPTLNPKFGLPRN
jgi:hypothetical protein